MSFERIDTHLSALLIAGDEVFKFKKPVRLPFADYSTPERRRRYCEEELRLNRRTAPELYRGVVTIAGEPALWMRRFDGAGLFDALARRGALTELHIDALAAGIARFQARLPPSPPEFDAAALAAHWAAANLRELQQPAGPLPDLVAWDAAQAQALAPLLHARQAAGAVVEGHGDLHLANIVWHQGRPCLFDALEFDPGLRHADRLADPAFTFMDLLDHGLPALAWRLISQWLEQGGDHDALPLLRWSAGYRALVRAKVAWLQNRPEVAARRIALARALAFPAAPPQLVLVAGLSGSGKSTVALQLVGRLGGVRLRSDVERKRLHGLAATARPATPALLYNPDSNARTYARLEAIAGAGLAGGVTVIVDAAFLKRSERAAMRALAAAAGARCRIVWCEASPATLQARITRRQATQQDASDAGADVLALQQQVAEWPAPEEHAERLDTEGPPEAVAARVQALPA